LQMTAPPGADGQGLGSSRWRLMHVADTSRLHLFTKNESTKCELWATLWSSSRVLAEILGGCAARDHLAGALTLEIGAGSGLCGLVAASHGAFVTASDSSEQALGLIHQSAQLNGIASSHLATRRLDWHSLGSAATSPESFDVVIGSDVLFLRMNVKAVAETVDRYLAPGGLGVIMDPGRPSAEEFQSSIVDDEALGLDVEALELGDVVVSPGRLLKRAVLYLLKRKGSPPTARSVSLRRGIIESWGFVANRTRAVDRGTEMFVYTEDLVGERRAAGSSAPI